MIKNREFEARVYQNKANYQYSLIPIKKNLSKKMLDLFSDKNIIGFKLELIEVLKVMPKPKLVDSQKRYLKRR